MSITVNAELITAIVALITAITTLVKVLQHGVILKDTQAKLNGQADTLQQITTSATVNQTRMDATITRLQKSGPAPIGKSLDSA
jgi:cell division FtsZ-interacting protein ZapD